MKEQILIFLYYPQQTQILITISVPSPLEEVSIPPNQLDDCNFFPCFGVNLGNIIQIKNIVEVRLLRLKNDSSQRRHPVLVCNGIQY